MFLLLISIGLLRRSSSMFKEFSLGCLMVASSHIIKKGKLAEMDIRCHSLYYSLSLVVPLVVTRCITRCHSLSFIVTRCHSLYYSLSLVVTRCHSLSLNVLLVCLFKNDRSRMRNFQGINFMWTRTYSKIFKSAWGEGVTRHATCFIL